MKELNNTYYKSNKIALYLRLSDDDGTNDFSNSIINQKELLLNYAKRNNLKVSDIYIDDGYSGMNFNRPNFKRMIQDIMDQKINVVITKSLDRFGRNSSQVGYYIEKFFPENRVRYVSLLEEIDTGICNVDEELILRMGFNNYYPLYLSNAIKSVLHTKQKSGLVVYPNVFGYKRDTEDKYKLLIDEKVKDIVLEIFNLYLDGYSLGDITKYLNEKKIATPFEYMKNPMSLKQKEKKWNKRTIANILKNRIYIGDLIVHKEENSIGGKKIKIKSEDWIIHENHHEAIIDICTFNKVQNKFESMKKYKSVYFNQKKLPFGYKNRSKVSDTIEIDDFPASIVREMFSLCIEGYGYRKIALILNAKEYPTRTSYQKKYKDQKLSNVWTNDTVKDVLNNPFYCCCRYLGNKLEDSLEKYDPIICKDTYLCARKTIKNRTLLVENRHPNKPLLYKYLYCSCGKKLQLRNDKLFCYASNIENHMNRINYYDLEKEILSLIGNKISKYINESNQYEQVIKIKKKELEKKKASYLLNQKKYMKNIDMLYSDRISGNIDKVLFQDTIQTIQENILLNDKKINTIADDLKKLDVLIKKRKSFVSEMLNYDNKISTELLDNLIKIIIIDQSKIKIKYKFKED